VILSAKPTNQFQNEIDLAALQTGMYIVRMNFEDQMLSKRFIKQ
jgi:hypothetical protein